MKFKEELTWILDNPLHNHANMYENYSINIDFVHSLGLKCDCVGWSNLDLDDPRTNEVLEQIRGFCKRTGWTSRGIFTREHVDLESDWYELVAETIRDGTYADSFQVDGEDGEKVEVDTIRAYHETTTAPKEWRGFMVPEGFRDVCMENGLKDLEFCWVKDVGKYEARQYFSVYANRMIPRMAVAWDLEKAGPLKRKAAGGDLHKVSKVIHKLQQINLPECYLKKDLPETGIACAYIRDRLKVLVHKDIARLLLQSKAIPARSLQPVLVTDRCPGGYTLQKTKKQPRPNAAFREQMLFEYRTLKANPRPVRQVTEKQALTAMRKAKSGQKDMFKKKMSKEQAEALLQTQYAPLSPYYLIANGGFLSSEYELLGYKAARETDREFFQALEKEELLENPPEGIVIGHCADGDHVLLEKTGRVIRFSHEEPDVVYDWPNLAQFVFDASIEEE